MKRVSNTQTSLLNIGFKRTKKGDNPSSSSDFTNTGMTIAKTTLFWKTINMIFYLLCKQTLSYILYMCIYFHSPPQCQRASYAYALYWQNWPKCCNLTCSKLTCSNLTISNLTCSNLLHVAVSRLNTFLKPNSMSIHVHKHREGIASYPINVLVYISVPTMILSPDWSVLISLLIIIMLYLFNNRYSI